MPFPRNALHRAGLFGCVFAPDAETGADKPNHDAEGTTAPEQDEPKIPVGNPRRNIDEIARRAYEQREAEARQLSETQEIEDDPEPEAEPDVGGEGEEEVEAAPAEGAEPEKPKPETKPAGNQPEQRVIPVRLPDGRVLYLSEQQAAVALQHGVQSIIGGARPQPEKEDPPAETGKGSDAPGIQDMDIESVVTALQYGDKEEATAKFKAIVQQLADAKSAAAPKGLTHAEAQELAQQAVDRKLAQHREMEEIRRQVTSEFPEVFENSDQGKRLTELAVVYRNQLMAELRQGRAQTRDGNPITDMTGVFREAARRASEFAPARSSGPTRAEIEERKMKQGNTPRPGLKAARKPADPDANLTVDQRQAKDRAAAIAQLQSVRRGVPLPR